jgi:hypothetical protein
MSSSIVWRIYVGFVTDIDIKILEVPPPGARLAFSPVYLMVHITKLQLQTTFPKPLYIPHSACKILMFALLVTREIATYN